MFHVQPLKFLNSSGSRDRKVAGVRWDDGWRWLFPPPTDQYRSDKDTFGKKLHLWDNRRREWGDSCRQPCSSVKRGFIFTFTPRALLLCSHMVTSSGEVALASPIILQKRQIIGGAGPQLKVGFVCTDLYFFCCLAVWFLLSLYQRPAPSAPHLWFPEAASKGHLLLI